MKEPSKLHRGPEECVGASWALCIDKLGHAASISFCYRAETKGPGSTHPPPLVLVDSFGLTVYPRYLPLTTTIHRSLSQDSVS